MQLRKRDESPFKEFVSVIAVHWQDGRIEPLRIQREDGTIIPISRVLDARQAASLRAGGQGTRYTCRFCREDTGREFEAFLFHDDVWWFIEREYWGK